MSGTFELWPQEVERLASRYDAIKVIIDFHDRQICEGEPMGYDCSIHHTRIAALKEHLSTLDREEPDFSWLTE